MSRTSAAIILATSLTFLVGPPVTTSLQSAYAPSIRKAEKRPATDQHGDPLPPFALARLGSTRLRHTDMVRQLAFTAGGRNLASLGNDGQFCTWEVATGKELLRCARQPVTSLVAPSNAFRRLAVKADRDEPAVVAFSADARLLAAVDSSFTIEVWDLAAGKELRRFGRNANATTSRVVAFSPDGKLLAAVGGEGVVHLWDIPTGKELRRLRWRKCEISRLTFSPSGAFLAGVSGENIRLWDVAIGKKVRMYEGHDRRVTAPPFRPTAIGWLLRAWILTSASGK
jgi:WD40 repeat protein